MPTTRKKRTTPQTQRWKGNFLTVRDLWTMSNAQFRAAVTLDELADETGRVDLPRTQIARVAGVSVPRLSEAVQNLISRGLVEDVVPGTRRGYRLIPFDERGQA